jgi:hypothetical protein
MGEKAANLPYPLRLFHAVHSLGQQSANTDFHPRDIIEGLTKSLEGATYLSAQRFPNSSNCSPNRMSLSLNESCNFRPGCMILHTPGQQSLSGNPSSIAAFAWWSSIVLHFRSHLPASGQRPTVAREKDQVKK